MQDIVIGLAIKWAVGEMASSAAATDWTAVKAKVHAAIVSSVHSAWLDAELTKVADQVIDGMAKVAQDQPDLIAAVKAVAGKNLPAAEGAVKALLAPVVTGDLASLLAA